MCKFDKNIGAYVLGWGDSIRQFAEGLVSKARAYGRPVRALVNNRVYHITADCDVDELVEEFLGGTVSKKNKEGYNDPTAYNGIRRAEFSDEQVCVKKLISCIYKMCDLAGYEIMNRVELRNVESGREWK